MTEIKFRGKRVDNGEWVHWNEYGECAEPFICKTGAYGYISKRDIVPGTVGQFTGLCDKSRKEIYEGDMCSTDLQRKYNIVVFRNGAFMYSCHDDGKDYFDIMLPTDEENNCDRYTKVIGNIHDNPELKGESI